MSGVLRSHAACAVLLVALAALYLVWTWSDQLASFGGDSAVYVLVARDFAPYLPADPVTRAVAQDSQFPPLYPLWLAAAGGAADMRLAHAATTLALIGAFAATYAWLLAIGLSRHLAAAGMTLFALLPGTLLQALQLHSESLYLALTLTCLTLLLRAESTRDPRLLWAAALVLAAALLTRTAGLSLLVPYGLVLLRMRPQRAVAMLVVSVLPAILWAVLHQPEYSYSDGLLSHYRDASPYAIVHRFYMSAQIMGWALVENVVQTTTLASAVAALGIVALLAAGARFVHLRADAWYLFAYLGMVTIWPYPAEALRFAWVAVPLLVGHLFKAADAAAARLHARGARGAAAWAPALVLALLTLPAFALAGQRFLEGSAASNPAVRHLPEWYATNRAVATLHAEAHLALAQAIGDLSRPVPTAECIFSIKPSLVAFYGGRRSVAPPRAHLDAAAFDAALAREGCQYFLLIAAGSPSFPGPHYPHRRLGDRLEVLETRPASGSDKVLVALARLR